MLVAATRSQPFWCPGVYIYIFQNTRGLKHTRSGITDRLFVRDRVALRPQGGSTIIESSIQEKRRFNRRHMARRGHIKNCETLQGFPIPIQDKYLFIPLTKALAWGLEKG